MDKKSIHLEAMMKGREQPKQINVAHQRDDVFVCYDR